MSLHNSLVEKARLRVGDCPKVIQGVSGQSDVEPKSLHLSSIAAATT